jgi:mono/diheme cytochrome c family protein
MKGMVIGGLGIVHVFLAQFAIGGGMLMCYLQWVAQTGGNPNARRFLDSYFQFLVLVSFVLGALTGVGMWFTSIQVSPRTIGLMVDEFHWLWATEWTFFCAEIFAGYAFYRYGARLPDRTRMRLLIFYSASAWFSLFWINGILSWQLTPGAWTQTRSVWDGFFNPSFWPSLLFRTVVSMTLAALVACIVVNTMADLDREARRSLIRRAAHFLAPMVAMPLLALWYFAVLPEDSRAWVLGGSTTMTLFAGIAAGSSLLVGGYAVVGLLKQKLYINGATATLLVALAFGATAGGEFVREGVRKPYTIRELLYSNAVRPDQVAHLRRVGSVARDPYPLRDAETYPPGQVRLGAKVYRFLCSVCHTLGGANGLTHLMGSWTLEQKRLNVAKLQYTKPFMPPFAGTAEELEALVQMVSWVAAGRPAAWDPEPDPGALARIRRWLEEAGTGSAPRPQRRAAVAP